MQFKKSNMKFCNWLGPFFLVMKPMVKPALQMMSSSERKKEIEIRDLMMSKTSFFHCENDQKKAHAIQAQV